MMAAAVAAVELAPLPPLYNSKRARLTLSNGGLSAPNHRQAAAGRRTRMLTIQFQVLDEHGPALRSAVEEITNEVGGRLEGLHRYAKENALTRAACALGALRAAVSRAVPAGDPQYV